MTLKRRFFSAPTLTQALLAAARHHSVDPEALDYEVVEKKTGFVKAPRGVVIDVDPDAPVKPGADAERTAPAPADSAPADAAPTEPAPAAPPPAEAEPTETTSEPPPPRAAEVPFEPAAGEAPAEHPALAAVDAPPAEAPASEPVAEPPREDTPWPSEETRETPAEVASSSPFGDSPAADDESADEPIADQPASSASASASASAPADAELRETVAEAIDELAFLASLRVQVAQVRSVDDGLEVELDGPDSERLAARGGRALLAMQHLLPRLLFGRLGKAPRCRVDCDGFHAARAERLDRLAQKAADRVRKGGRSWLLEPMAPDERRLVHLALAEVPDIETESVGEGFLKRVRVAQVESAQSSSR